MFLLIFITEFLQYQYNYVCNEKCQPGQSSLLDYLVGSISVILRNESVKAKSAISVKEIINEILNIAIKGVTEVIERFLRKC